MNNCTKICKLFAILYIVLWLSDNSDIIQKVYTIISGITTTWYMICNEFCGVTTRLAIQTHTQVTTMFIQQMQ